MEEDKEYSLRVQSLQKDVTPENQNMLLKEENEKLKSENATLRKKLQVEETLHRILQNQWKQLNESVTYKFRELEQLKAKQYPRSNVYQYATYALLLVIALLIVFDNDTPSSQTTKITGDITKPPPANKNPVSPTAGIANNPQTITTSLVKKDSGTGDAMDTASAKAASIPADTQKVDENTSPVYPKPSLSDPKNPPRYIVKAKSYFHDKPDTGTRRGTFVLPWEGEYGILTALDDMNGFIYIVFTNHAGRKSKGWILKKDLDPLQ